MSEPKREAPVCPKCNAAGTIGVWTSTVGPHAYTDIVYCTECGHIVGVLPHTK